jgi:trk system potassium uptake protein TrkH
MKFRSVFHLISYLLFFCGLAIGFSGLVGWWQGDSLSEVLGLFGGAGVGVVGGAVLGILTRGRIQLSRRDGFGVVTFGWLSVATLGMLPYLFGGIVDDPASAFFETMSGFTTTGASVLTNLESLPRGILFWRAMTQWLGGMGVLVLCVAILPFLGVGGMQIYQAEMPGPGKDRLTPRIASTAKLLWGIYVLLTLLQVGFLSLGHMSIYDAFCHAFTTMSTGGFSTMSASVAAFDSAYIDWVVIVFMFLAGANFSLHFRALRGEWQAFHQNPEFRFYFVAVILGSAFTSIGLWHHDASATGAETIRHSFFQVTSILTTTGYATRDFNAWPLAIRFLLFLCMFAGGCGGSTAGGVKIIRVFVLFKQVLRDLRRAMIPQSVARIKLGKTVLDEIAVGNIVSFFVLFITLFAGMTLIMTRYTPDFVTACSSVIACLGNVGPGLGAVGPVEVYAFIPAPGKVVLSLAMLLGRLELYTVVLLLFPAFWRK